LPVAGYSTTGTDDPMFDAKQISIYSWPDLARRLRASSSRSVPPTSRNKAAKRRGWIWADNVEAEAGMGAA